MTNQIPKRTDTLEEKLARWQHVAEELYITVINELGDMNATREYEELKTCE